ncbi:hypothetical protein [Halorubrum sp. AJ67]|uniref:hypothetical protein n=1 Tax=Halorubrum sp. AJ67 TaxID=1173487 RepID=UPI0003DC530A|nr:hypothetical protein [Halorubrum sp. AJ67]CDK39478.1 uncharacterized protein BN903_30 [Halorubrum sp. AJ67]
MKHNGTNLDGDSLRVLDALYRQDDHRLNTSEVRSVTGIESNDRARRRIEKLGAAELADIDKDERASTPIPPKRATLTEEGVEKAEEWDLDPNSTDIRSPEARLQRVERRLNDLEERFDQLESAATRNPDRIPELLETRRLVATLSEYVVTELDADLGVYYPLKDNLEP